jgi:hypothetical protein
MFCLSLLQHHPSEQEIIQQEDYPGHQQPGHHESSVFHKLGQAYPNQLA